MLDGAEKSEEEEANEDDTDDVEHLGATNLPSYVIHPVLTSIKKEPQGDLD